MAWEIKYHNLSSQTFDITKFGGITQDVVGIVNHQPADTLPTGSQDYLSLDQNAFKFIAEGDIDIYQGVIMHEGTLWVRLHVPFQMFGIGTSPYWYCMFNDGKDPGLDSSAWAKHDSDTVVSNIKGIRAKMSPTKDHSDITLDVLLDDVNS